MSKKMLLTLLFLTILCLCSCTKTAPIPKETSVETVAAVTHVINPVPVVPVQNPFTGAPSLSHLQGKRPVAVMIDNVKAAMPQCGLADADIVYEMVTESGITRLMAMYSDYEAMPNVGPLRSARDQHVAMMLPFNSLFLHIGTSTYAADLLETFHYKTSSINGIYNSDALVLDTQRNKTTAIEHCWFSNGELFTQCAKNLNLRLDGDIIYSAFNFAPQPRQLQGGVANYIDVRFSSYATSNFVFDKSTNKYYKSQFGNPQIDANTGEQIGFDNLFILFTEISKYPDGILAKVNYNLNGVGFYFSGGNVEKVRWYKGASGNPLLILSGDGTEQHVEVNKGNSYVAMADLSTFEHFSYSESPIIKYQAPESLAGDDVEYKDNN